MKKLIIAIKKEIFYWKLRFKDKTQSEIKYYRQFYVDKYLARKIEYSELVRMIQILPLVED